MLELEELKHEKELQREEIQKLQGQVHTLRTEIQVRTDHQLCCYEHTLQAESQCPLVSKSLNTQSVCEG